jgi:hypothetical protein
MRIFFRIFFFPLAWAVAWIFMAWVTALVFLGEEGLLSNRELKILDMRKIDRLICAGSKQST